MFCNAANAAPTPTFTKSASTCGANIITDESMCTAAAAALGFTWDSAVGSEWQSGCLFHRNTVYFSPVEDGSADQPTEAYICMSGGLGWPARSIGYISVVGLCKFRRAIGIACDLKPNAGPTETIWAMLSPPALYKNLAML